VNYDLDWDGELDYSLVGWTAEQEAIIDEAKDTDYDYNVFVVKDFDGLALGITKNKQRYIFVRTQGQTAAELKNTIAHELGHAFGDLDDIPLGVDDDNLMSEYYLCPWRLRKDQWDTTQNYHN
jgi:hypothetical protein